MNEHPQALVRRAPALDACTAAIEGAFAGGDARVELGAWQIRTFVAAGGASVRELDLLERDV